MEYQHYVERVGKILAHVMHAPVKEEIIQEYIDQWYIAKSPWIRLFGDNTIYTYPEKVECVLSDEEKKTQIEKYIYKLKTHNYHYTFGRPAFIEFLREQGAAAAENLVAHDFVLSDEITIPKGMKLLRAFKHFFTEKEDITQAQDEMNLIISQTKFSGYLHFSVDPLDYLSASENTFGWRSCHSLDGDYAAGNLEYMMDKATVMCYIDDNTTTKLPNFPDDVPWNSKRWRMLLFFAPDHRLIIAGRQYPFTAPGILPIIRNCINDFFHDTVYEPRWTNQYIEGEINITDDTKLVCHERHLIAKLVGRIYPISIMYNSHGNLHYDDVLDSTVYTHPYYLIGYRHYSAMRTNFEPIEVGVENGAIMCPVCGYHYFYRGEGLDCENVDDDLYTCECCGHRHFHENEGAWVGDQWWCQTCVDNNAVICSRCGELCNIENVIFNEKTGENTCITCYRNEGDRRIWQ